MIQQSPDNHTMLNHTTLLFATNLPRIKWNVTNFALIMAQKALIITQFYSSFLHLIPLFISFCQPENIVSGFGGQEVTETIFKCLNQLILENTRFDYLLFVTIHKVVKQEYFPYYCQFSFGCHALILQVKCVCVLRT